MSFTQQTVDFLFENRMHDSREWFKEHKSDYQQLVIAPMTELINELAPTIAKIDFTIAVDPKHISRLYRDARYAKDSVFRDHVWYTFGRTRDTYMGYPGFYFSIGAAGVSYGCGYYCASSKTMRAMRELVLEDSADYCRAQEAYAAQKVFEMFGEMYKRSKYPNESPEKQNWLNRKGFGMSFETNDPKIMFSSGLAKRVAKDFLSIRAVYDFMLAAEQRAAMIE